MKQPELIGRQKELAQLTLALEETIKGNGSTLLISGEAGIGKTRLVNELFKEARKRNVQVSQGWCLAESQEPLIPIRSILKELDMLYVMSDAPPPLSTSLYLIDKGGMLVAKAEREETELDPDIFASMLKAVGDFVNDSLSMMGKGGGAGLNSLGYERYKILVRSLGDISLAAVIEGNESEFLIDDMKSILADSSEALANWTGNMAEADAMAPRLTDLIGSGKYDGRFLVDDAKIKQENLFDNVLLGIQRSATDTPLLIFLDDVQWADPTTLNLMHYLARNTRQSRVLMISTFRPEDIIALDSGRPHHLETTMQNMSRESLFNRIDLKRLEPKETEEMITSALGKVHLKKEFLARIFRETEGTPFFVLEITRLLVEDGAITQDEEEGWKITRSMEDLDIPSKVYDVIKRRLDRVKIDQKDILECASVIGNAFTSAVIGRTLELNRIKLLKNLREIENDHRLIHYLDEGYIFDHAKIRDVLYTGIGAELRKEYHLMVAEAMMGLGEEELGDILDPLAYHFSEARDKRAGDHLIRAANRARDRYANEEAIHSFKNALHFTDDDNIRPMILESLAEIQIQIGDYDEALPNLNILSEIVAGGEDIEIQARVLRLSGETYEKKGDFDRSLELFDQARQLIGSVDPMELGRILVGEGSAFWRKGSYDDAMNCFKKAYDTFEGVEGAMEDSANALRMVGNIYISQGEKALALDNSEKSLMLMEKIGNLPGIASALNNIGIVHRRKGDLDLALEYQTRGLEIREKTMDKRGIAFSLINLGNLNWDRGDLSMALQNYENSLNIMETMGDRQGTGLSLSNIGLVHMNRGDLDLALEYQTRGLSIREKIMDRHGIAESLYNIALLHLAMRNPDLAQDYFERCLVIYLELGDKCHAIQSRCGLAETSMMLGETSEAFDHGDKALEISVETGSKREEGMSHRVLGMIHREKGDIDKASNEFEKAMMILEDVGERTELAYLFYEYALLLKIMGDPGKAEEYLDKASGMFSEMGMKLWVEKVGGAKTLI